MSDQFEKMMREAVRDLRMKVEREGFSDDAQDRWDELNHVVLKCGDMLGDFMLDQIDHNKRKLALLKDREVCTYDITSLELH